MDEVYTVRTGYGEDVSIYGARENERKEDTLSGASAMEIS